MRRGFKAEAERIAMEVRDELCLDPMDKLDPMDLAHHLGIPVATMQEASQFSEKGAFRRYFSREDPESFSAITIVVSFRRIIVHNEHHHPNRQASNLAHELSHTLLEHEPTELIGEGGRRHWNAAMEQEATWLGAALLVPREGALSHLRRGLDPVALASHYGVSDSLLNWRIAQTGIRAQIQRASQFRW